MLLGEDWYQYTQGAKWHQCSARVESLLVPAIRDCEVNVLIAGEPDPKLAIELGMSILLGKPLIVVVLPNRTPSFALLKVATRVVTADPETRIGQRKIQDEIREVAAAAKGARQ